MTYEWRDGAGRWRGHEHDERYGSIAVRLRGAELVAHLAARDIAILRFDDDPELAAGRERRVDRHDEVALLRTAGVAGVVARSFEQVVGAPGELAEQLIEEALEVGALGRRLRALAGSGVLGGFECDERLLDRLEAVVDLGPELVQRRMHPGGIEELGESRAIAVEVRLEHGADPPDRGVAAGAGGQLVDHRAELGANAPEPPVGAGQAPLRTP